MPNCPRCFKYFSSEWGIAFHLAQPCCPCHNNNYVFALEVPHLPAIALVDDVDLVGIASPMCSPSPHPLDLDLPDKPLAALLDLAADEDDIWIEDVPPFPEAQYPHPWVMDYFEGASATYGTGNTFLSQFNKDKYLEQ